MTLQHDLAQERDDRDAEPVVTPPAAKPWLMWLQYLSLLLAMIVWARLVTGRTGGRDAGALVYGPLSLLPALVALRPSLRHLRPLAALVVSSLVVCFFAPFGFVGGETVALAAYSAAAYALVRAFAVTTDRRHTVAGAVCLVSLDQFSQGFLAWWGGRDPHHLMLGTFYWHNQFAAFLLPGVIIGASLAVFGGRIDRIIGFVSAPVCLAGVIYSASRASMVIALAGLLTVAVVAVLAPDRADRVKPVGLLALACVGTMFFFTSPIFFPHWASPFGATDDHNVATPVGMATGDRLDFWGAAVGEYLDRPLLGGGFGSYGELSGNYLPVASLRTAAAHNAPLQALAEGGTLWGLSVVICMVALGIGALRRAVPVLRRASQDRAVALGGTVTLLALLLHACVDFDWSYPTLVISTAVVGGLVLSVPRRVDPAVPARRTGARVRWAATAAGCAGLLLGAQIAHAHDATGLAINKAIRQLSTQGASAGAARVMATRSWFPDVRIDEALLSLGLSRGVGVPLALPKDLMSEAVRGTADYATANDDVNARRAAVLLQLGRTDEALSTARSMAQNRVHRHPASLQAYSLVLDLAGRRDEAVDLLAGTLVRRSPQIQGNAPLAQQLFVLYQILAKLAPDSLQVRCAGSALTAAHVTLNGAEVLAAVKPSDSCVGLAEKGWA